MERKICVKCAHQNEEHFTYCKYCGALLPVVDRQPFDSTCSEGAYNEACSDSCAEADDREYRMYVDKNSDNIVSAFADMQKNGKKTSFCTPVFFLGIFFGFYGISAWFLSRKMKKYGFLLLLLGVAFTFIDAFLNYELNRELFGQLTAALSSGSSYNLTQNASLYSYDTITISGYISFVCSFIFGFFSLHLYKNKATRDILRIKENYTEESPLPLNLLLRKAGGRQAYMAFIPLAVAVIANLLSFVVTVI